MPADTNTNGDIFGGWLLSQMDVAGGILAKNIALGRVATVAIEGMKFLLPVKVGDTVTCYGRVLKTGNSSITVNLLYLKICSNQQLCNRLRIVIY